MTNVGTRRAPRSATHLVSSGRAERRPANYTATPSGSRVSRDRRRAENRLAHQSGTSIGSPRGTPLYAVKAGERVPRGLDRPLHPPHPRQRQPTAGMRARVVQRLAPQEGHTKCRRRPPRVVAHGTFTTCTSAAHPFASRWTHGVLRHAFGPSSTFKRAVLTRSNSSANQRFLALTGAPPP